MRPFTALALISLLTSGCYYDNEAELYGPGCDASVFSYSAKIDPILQANCRSTACHGPNGTNGELVTYSQVKATVDNGTFRNQVVVTKAMPSGGALTSCELDLIEKWLDAGAPND